MKGKLMNLFDDTQEDFDENTQYQDQEYFSTTFPELIEHDLWQGENY